MCESKRIEDELDKTSNFLDIEVEEEYIVVNDVQCSGLNSQENGDVISGFLEHTNRNISVKKMKTFPAM